MIILGKVAGMCYDIKGNICEISDKINRKRTRFQKECMYEGSGSYF